MTPDEAEVLQKAIDLMRRGALQWVRASELLANYLNSCYNETEYLEIDETITVADATE